MSTQYGFIYNPPIQDLSVFNADNFISNSSFLTKAEADALYLSLDGGILYGILSCTSGLVVETSLTIDLSPTNGYILSCNASGVCSWVSPDTVLTYPILAPNGSNTNPTYSFSSSTSSGLYSPATNQVGISVSGVDRFLLTTSAITSTLPFIAPNGSTSACSYSFSSATNTGMIYNSGSSSLNFINNTSTYMQLNSLNIIAEVPLKVSSSGNSTPAGAPLYVIPSSTALSGSSNYYFSYYDTPPTSGSTTGTASTLYINSAPSNATTMYALNVNSGKVRFGATSNQLILGTTELTTISATAPVSSLTYTIPDQGGNANFVLSAGTAQTISSNLSLSGTLKYTGSTPTNGYVLTSDGSGNATWAVNSAIYAGFGDGMVGTPSIYFTNETNTGFYRPSAGNIGMTIGGVQILDIDSTAMVFTKSGYEVLIEGFLFLNNDVPSYAVNQGNLFNLGGMTALNCFISGNLDWDGSVIGAYLNIVGGIITVNNASHTNGSSVALYAPVFTNTSVDTITNASTLYIDGSPTATGSETITNTYSIYNNAGVIFQNDSTNSSSSSTGSIVTKGGLGVGKSVYIANDIHISGQIYNTGTNQPNFYVLAGANQSIGTASPTVINAGFNDAPVINQGFTSWASGVLTIATTGVYIITYQLIFAFNATGTRESIVDYNSGTTIAQISTPAVATPIAVYQNGCVVFTLNATDTIDLQGVQTSGTSLNVLAGTFLTVTKLF